MVYKVTAVWAPPPVEWGHNHPAKTPWPATAHLRSAGSQELPKMLWHRSWVTTLQQTFPEAQQKASITCGAGLVAQQSRVSRVMQHQLFRGQASVVCTCRFHQNNVVPAWLFGRRLNMEMMASSCRPRVCQAPHRNNNGYCPSSSYAEATQLCPSLHVPGLPELPLLHQRSGQCPQMSKSLCHFYRRAYGFPVALHPMRKGRQSSWIFT